MGRIECVCCEKLQCDFVSRTYALIAPVHPICTEFHAVMKQSQMHPKTMKRTKTWVLEPMGWIGCVHCHKFWHDFVARNFALIVPVQYVLHHVSCSYEIIRNELKHCATNKNMSLGTNGEDRARSLWKITTWLRGTNFCINCTSSPRFALNFMQLRNDPKCTQTLWNAQKHECWIQWGGSGAIVATNSDTTSWHEILH